MKTDHIRALNSAQWETSATRHAWTLAFAVALTLPIPLHRLHCLPGYYDTAARNVVARECRRLRRTRERWPETPVNGVAARINVAQELAVAGRDCWQAACDAA